MKVKQEITHKILPFGYQVETTLQKDLRPGELSLFTHAIISNFNDLLLNSQALLNLKGRDPLNIIAPELNLPAPQNEELLFINGFLPASKEKNGFQFMVESEFTSFPDTHHISFRLKRHATGLPAWLRPELLAWLAPITITGFRLGLESFKSKRFSSLFGFVPVVSERLLIEANQNSLVILLFSEGLNLKNQRQLQYMAIEQRLKLALLESFNFNLEKDLAA